MRPLLRAEESQDYNKDKSTFTDFYVRKCAFVLVWRLFARSRSPPCLICIIQKQIRIRRLQMLLDLLTEHIRILLDLQKLLTL